MKSHRGGGVVVGSNFNHSFQAVDLLQVSRLCSGNTQVVTWQPDDWGHWAWHDPRYLICVVSRRYSSGGRRGGTSGCAHAARSVTVRLSSVVVAEKSADGA
jgi:hypothetical protein